MTYEKFAEQYARLSKLFGAVKAESRAGEYYNELRKISDNAFEDAVTFIARNDHRFPSVARILEVVQLQFKPEELKKQLCNECDGFGWVRLGNTIFKSRCEHAKRLSEHFQYVPNPENRDHVLRKLAEQDLEIYGCWPAWATELSIFEDRKEYA